MLQTVFPDLSAATPEIFLFIVAMALLMVGVFAPAARAAAVVGRLALLSLVVALVMVLMQDGAKVATFENMFIVDRFSIFMKVLVLIGSALTLLMSGRFFAEMNARKFEYPVLVVLATLGMMMMISANDLIALYMGLEIQSLALYVLAAFLRDQERSTEAGLKYFVLGALSSGMLLYGASMVYGFAGTTQFAALAEVLKGGEVAPGIIIGIVFIAAGLAFKVSAVPFHMWTPDVYEGAPTPVTAFFAVAPKVAAIALFLRVMLEPFGGIAAEWRQVIVFLSVASMILGAFAAIRQNNIKRLMAYSSIGHVGYALLGLAVGTSEGIRAVLVYMAIYLTMNIGTFACILAMRRQGQYVEQIPDLAGLSKRNLPMAIIMMLLMFSLAGVPPLAGFFGKFYVFKAVMEMSALSSGWTVLAVIGVLSSVVGAFYYLRIVKVMFFDEAVEPLDLPSGRELGLLMGLAGAFNLFFFPFAGPLLRAAGNAAAALF